MAKRKRLEIPMWLVVTIAVIFIGSLYLYTKPQNDTGDIDKYVTEYIDNSVEVDLHCKYEPQSIKFDQIYVGVKLNKLHRSKLTGVSNNQYSVYDNDLNKYFRIILIGGSFIETKTNSSYVNEGTLVKARINQDQFNDPTYGTKEKPIPILYLEIPRYKKSQNYYLIEKTPEEYKEAVYYYLAYLMPKDEFKKMFKNQ